MIQPANGFQRAPFAKGDDWCAASLGFDGGDSEIFLRHEDKGFRALHIILQNLCFLKTKEGHIRPRQGLDLLKIGAIPDHDQFFGGDQRGQPGHPAGRHIDPRHPPDQGAGGEFWRGGLAHGPRRRPMRWRSQGAVRSAVARLRLSCGPGKP